MTDNVQAHAMPVYDASSQWAARQWCVLGFALAASLAGCLQALREDCAAPDFDGPARARLLALVTLGLAVQWLLAACCFRRVFKRHANCRQLLDNCRSWLWIVPPLAGAIYGWSCATYLVRVAGQVPWAFPAYLLLSSAIPSIIFLILTREDPFPELPECPACKYLLFFASHQRCPECGRAFSLAEIGTCTVELDADGILRPKSGVLERIEWSCPDERGWQWTRHALATFLIVLCLLSVFNAAAYRLNTSGDEPLWLYLGVSVLIAPAAIVTILYPNVRRRIIRSGRRGRVFLAAVVAAWVIVEGLAIRLS